MPANEVLTKRSRARNSQASTSPWLRAEDANLVTGQDVFVGDVSRPGQLYMRVVRSSVAHGRISGIDLSHARAAPGVAMVMAAQDLDDVPRIPLRINDLPQLSRFLQPVLATTVVRYVGEPVAVVVAQSEREAEDAADLVDVDIDPLSPVVDIEEEQVSPIWNCVPDGCLASLRGSSGDFEEASREADLVVSEVFDVARDTGLPLETRGLVAEWSKGGTQLDVWGPAKLVRFTRQVLAGWFDVSLEKVVCHHVKVGGMFGPRGEIYPEDYLVPLAARVLKCPVKWIEDRLEHMVAINHGRGVRHRISVAVSAEGKLLGLRDEILQDYGAYVRPIGSRLLEAAVEVTPGPYRWPVVDVVGHAITTNKTPMATMRAPGPFESGFVRERMMDLVATRLGIEPLELRRRNLLTADEMPYRQDFGPQMPASIYDSGDYHLVLDKLIDKLGLSKVGPEIDKRRQQGELVGLGYGLFLAHAGLGVEESIKLEVTPEGRLRILTAGSEIGQGLASMLRTVVSETLGVTTQQIDVVTNSTENFDGGTGTNTSRSTIFSGSAALDAARKLASVLDSKFPEADPKNPETWRSCGRQEIIGTHKQERPTFGFGAHAAVVCLDRQTLVPTIERLIVAYDCGRAIDRGSVISQLVGGAAQGVGGTFLQEITYDDQAQPQSTTFMDYQVPTIFETPEVETVVLELPGTVGNPLGVKGAGEAGIIGVGGALANAVAAAIDEPTSIVSLPITPDTLLPYVDCVPGQNVSLSGAPPELGSHLDAAAIPREGAKTFSIRGARKFKWILLTGILTVVGIVTIIKRVRSRFVRTLSGVWSR